MKDIKVLIICVSVHQGNTFKIAKAMSESLDAKIVEPESISLEELINYDLIGFGSGIYNQKHHQRIFDFITKLPTQNHKKAFIFSTNTFGLKKLNEPLKSKLVEKGFTIVGEFSCPGFINYGLIKYLFGGLNKNRPNNNDLINVQEFSKKMLSNL